MNSLLRYNSPEEEDVLILCKTILFLNLMNRYRLCRINPVWKQDGFSMVSIPEVILCRLAQNNDFICFSSSHFFPIVNDLFCHSGPLGSLPVDAMDSTNAALSKELG